MGNAGGCPAEIGTAYLPLALQGPNDDGFVESAASRNVSVTIQPIGRNIQRHGIGAPSTSPTQRGHLHGRCAGRGAAPAHSGRKCRMRRDTVQSGHAHLLRELNEERAAALARIARHLDTLLTGLRELRMQAEQTGEDERAALRARYDVLREEA